MCKQYTTVRSTHINTCTEKIHRKYLQKQTHIQKDADTRQIHVQFHIQTDMQIYRNKYIHINTDTNRVKQDTQSYNHIQEEPCLHTYGCKSISLTEK